MARLKNGSPDLSEDPAPILIPTLIQCEGLWKDRGKRRSWPNNQWSFVRRTIEPLLYARIEPEPEHYDGGLLNPRGVIQAQAIELSSVSFENGPIPVISAYAQFQMTFDRAFADTGEFYEWQEQTDWMDWALCFGFRFEDGGEWDATWEHGGIDFEIVTP
ncbi:hypothetical protein [Methylobacterium sp. WL7]|uniref:hypothetical protein n=1 Tax=Methylobacterium sp. WL7 TaxID=2603900 RepID=UPI0011C79B58|nr:hypothetical protein [Methylobacterium sp. WL7]TXN39498.1 hypothetical protein FV233_28010 [Methylobacterium sp. WL7]